MNAKNLTSSNGDLLQLTITPWERKILYALSGAANIPQIVKNVGAGDIQSVGNVLRTFYLILEGRK